MSSPSENDVMLLSEDEDIGTVTASDFVSSLQFGRFHIRLLLACGSGWLIDNMWQANLKFVLPFFRREFELTAFAASMLIILEWIGSALGGLVFGVLGDKIGRRMSFMISLVLSGVFGLATGFAPLLSLLYMGIFFLFFAAGGNLPIDGAMFAEFMPTSVRGPAMVILSTFWSIGSMLAGILCWVILPFYSCDESGDCDPWKNIGWRIVFISTAILNLSFAFVRIGLPESVKFLEITGKHKQAKRVIHSIIKTNKSSRKVPKDLVFENEVVEEDQKSAIKLMFSPKYRRTTIILAIGWFVTWSGIACFDTFLPELFIRKGLDTIDVYRNTFIYVSVGVLSTIVGSFLIDTPLGRKWTLVLSCLVSGVMMGIFEFADSQATIIIFSGILNFANYVFFAAIYTYTPEVYPTVIRTTSFSLMHLVARIGSIGTVFYAGLMVDAHLVDVLVFTGSACMIIAGISFAFLDIRTKGRVLE
eukprot:TRINITY_DN6956_c0_g1_i1.p1 TRINITY_DN6956_c0_g1~~TRINITY_DN6956_c0_g1_i1.p1  ORF type:complete len:474 (-),score=46.83 TRINITY_DN6956_c0_g1_i1:6-1427(-)